MKCHNISLTVVFILSLATLACQQFHFLIYFLIFPSSVTKSPFSFQILTRSPISQMYRTPRCDS